MHKAPHVKSGYILAVKQQDVPALLVRPPTTFCLMWLQPLETLCTNAHDMCALQIGP